VQEMTEIISGLQGSIPSNSRKGFPYVGGKYVINYFRAFFEIRLHFIIFFRNFLDSFSIIYTRGSDVWLFMPNLLFFFFPRKMI